MSASFVYCTAASREDALRIGRVLVDERLAACVNVFDGMTSVYRWEGAVEEANEAVLIAKTQTVRVARVIERVKSLHEYSCPCVVSWEIGAGNADYLKWIVDETGGTG